MDTKASIRAHFDDENRIQQDIDSYHLSHATDKPIDPYELPRENFIFSLIQEQPFQGPLLDIGCGIGTLVRKLICSSVDAYGIDLSPHMIKTAKSLLKQGDLEERVQCADIFEYQPPQKFQRIVANGVIWYYQDKLPFLNKVHDLLDNDGISIIVHRNELFNLCAMNQGTIDFMCNQLFMDRTVGDKTTLKNHLLNDFPNMSSPVSINSNLQKPYDNPLTIAQLYEKAGLEVQSIFATYIHPFPPKYIPKENQHIDYAYLQEHYGKKWQGLFLGSQFIVIAKKKATI